MARGRKPKPTAEKIASGAAAHDPQRINRDEPRRPTGWPDKPANVGRVGLAEWRRVCAEQEAKGVLSTTDRALLELYAISYEQMVGFLNHVKRHGRMMRHWDGNGNEVWRANPAVREAARCRQECARMLAEMGLSPTSSARVRVAAAESSDAAAFLRLVNDAG